MSEFRLQIKRKEPKPTACAMKFNKHQQGRKPPYVRWIQSVSQVNIMLRVSMLDVWTPRCSNVCWQWIYKSFGGKHDFIWPWKSLDKLASIRDRFVVSSYPGPTGAEAECADVRNHKSAWHILRLAALSYFPLLESVLLSRFDAKAIFNLLFGCRTLAIFPYTRRYVKRQYRVCVACDLKNMQFLLV